MTEMEYQIDMYKCTLSNFHDIAKYIKIGVKFYQ